MKQTLTTLAAVVGMVAAAGSARADPGGFAPPTGQGGYPMPSASGEFHAPNTLLGLGAPTPGKPPDRYGLLPGLRRAFRIHDGCDTCGGKGGHFAGCGKAGGCGPFGLLGHGPHGHAGHHGHGGFGAGHGHGSGYPPVMQGTLVFPHHTFVRSPRDYFMYEPGR